MRIVSWISLCMAMGCENQTKALVEEINDAVIVVDSDGDGFQEEEECDDGNPLINPEAVELCDGVDNNCDESQYCSILTLMEMVLVQRSL